MQILKATGLDRKSGGAQWRDLRFSGPFLEMFFRQSVGVRAKRPDRMKFARIPTRYRPWDGSADEDTFRSTNVSGLWGRPGA